MMKHGSVHFEQESNNSSFDYLILKLYFTYFCKRKWKFIYFDKFKQVRTYLTVVMMKYFRCV